MIPDYYNTIVCHLDIQIVIAFAIALMWLAIFVYVICIPFIFAIIPMFVCWSVHCTHAT